VWHYARPVDALARLSAEPALAAVLLDVDGTLAPIVPDPAEARVPEGTREELRRLSHRYALVACISGRPGDVARAIVGVPELTYVGEHGLELDPDAPAWAGRIHAFARDTGRAVEEKPISAAFHFRRAPDHEAARRALEVVAASAEAQGFKTRWGRLVLEVLPPLDITKGTAVRRLLAERALRRALYAGDDTTDLDAFAALDGLDVAVRVGVVTPESPPLLRERADIVVESPSAFAALLAEL
jgi:trehalose 6-phosphate phosphatase